MTWWNDITHVGAFSKVSVQKRQTIYKSVVNDVRGAVNDTADAITGASLGNDLTSDIEGFTHFIVTKANGIVKHYMDTDGDGVFNKKKDDLIIKGRAPSSFSLADEVGEASSLLGDFGTTYIHGLQYVTDEGLDSFKSAIGLASDLSSDLGFWDTIDHGITTVGKVMTRTLNVSVQSGDTSVHVGASG